MQGLIQQNNQDYKVNLDVFEGPLDLLLHLIKKNDMDIYNIQISVIIEQYLKYVETLEEMNIDVAGEFLVLAAELAQIKSKMLLPTEGIDGEVEEEDPRADLVRRLLEYQRYKEAASELTNRYMLNRDVFKQQTKEDIKGLAECEVEASVYNLVEAFHAIIARAPMDVYHEITVDRISVNERIFQIIEMMKSKPTLGLEDLLPEPITKYSVVITFLSLMEMCKLRMIRIGQIDNFEKIVIETAMQDIGSSEILKLVDQSNLSF